MKKAVVFGGGNIGRSFITPVLQEAAYKVTIADINETLVEQLNERRAYPVIVRSTAGDETRMVRGFDSVAIGDKAGLMNCLMQADLISSSVGQAGLSAVCDLLAELLPLRNRDLARPLDLILAENIRDGAAFCRERLAGVLGRDYPLAQQLGLVETSIGKMVPLLTEEDRSRDPLILCAEPYNTLILDRDGFLGEPPVCSSTKLVSPIGAWVDRKLFIHNLGHAASAYLGRRKYPEKKMIWEVLEDEELRGQVRSVMGEGAAALKAEYPSVFTGADLDEHIEDLLFRFRNRALGDTVQRVGRDLRRKLNRDDRVVGAMTLARSHGLPFDHILDVYRAALLFGNDPEAAPEDRDVSALAAEKGVRHVFRILSQPDQNDLLTKHIAELLDT